MNQPHQIDPQRLAALLDGRLSETEAAEVRGQLALADDDTLSAYADAVAISAELQALDASIAAPEVSVTPIAAARPGRRWAIPIGALAAAVLLAVVVLRGTHRTATFEHAAFATALAPSAHTLDGPAWTVMRGGPSVMGDGARAARAGALLTDIEVDAKNADTARVRSDAAALATVLDGVGQAATLRSLAMSATLEPRRIRESASGALVSLGDPASIAGAWLEAARIATAGGDAGFFDRFPTAALDDLRDDHRFDPSVKTMLERLTVLTTAPARDAAAIQQAVTDLLRAVTR